MSTQRQVLHIPVPVEIARMMLYNEPAHTLEPFVSTNYWCVSEFPNVPAYDTLETARDSWHDDVAESTDLAVIKLTYSDALHEKLTGRAGEAAHHLKRQEGDRWALHLSGLREILNHPETELAIIPARFAGRTE